MSWTGNTVPFKTVWINAYEATHYKQAVFPMFADQRFEKELTSGSTVKWSYDADMDAQSMGADGSYTVDNRTVTDETLTISSRPAATFRIPMTEKIQDHRPTQEKWARKSMNVIFNKVDGDVLGALKAGAAASLSAGDFGGTSGDPITVSSSNAAAIFTAARRQLRNQNVIYDETKKFKNVIQYDTSSLMGVAAIPAELEEQLLLQIGFKNTDFADEVMKQGYLGMLYGFNTVVSTALPASATLTETTIPTDATTITIGGVVVAQWETGTPTNAGDVKAETSATASITNLVNYLNDPYSSISGKSVAQTRTSLTIAQRRIFDNISAVDNLDGSCVITVNGQGALTWTTTDTTGTFTKKAVHALMGTNMSIALVMQRYPELSVSAGAIVGNGSTGGYVAQDFVTWALYGKKVFLSQSKQMVNVPISSTTFSAPASVLN